MRYKTIMVDGVRKLEHVAVWEAKYGPKPEGCDIHHINGNHLDNRIENLQLMTKAEHARLHREGKLSGTDVIDATDPVIIEDRKKKSEYAKQHRLAHHDEAVKKDHDYQMAHGDQIRARAKEWYQENYREIREHQRQYELAHKAERAKRNAEYYAAHTEERKEYWRRRQQEKATEIAAKKREYVKAHAEEIRQRRELYKPVRNLVNKINRAKGKGDTALVASLEAEMAQVNAVYQENLKKLRTEGGSIG